MKSCKKWVFGLLLTAAVVLPAAGASRPAALTAEETDVPQGYYAYLPDHSIYFLDVDSDWYWAYRAVDCLTNGGVIAGDGNRLFHPSANLTRADFLVLLYRAYGMEAYRAAPTFADVEAGAYYADALGAAEQLGIAEGERFRPTEPITRAEAALLLVRTLALTGIEPPAAALPEGLLPAGEDREAFAALVGSGVLSGGSDGSLRPSDPLTRAEAAVLLYRALHLDASGRCAADAALINLCIGDTIYTDVRIVGDAPRAYGLVRCESFGRTAEGYFIELGEAAELSQQVEYADGVLLLDGEEAVLSEQVVCIDVSPYSTLDGPVSTGETYRAARAALIDGVVTELYYTE